MASSIREAVLVGTGAVGSLYGGNLAQVGVRVAAVCRSDYDVVRRAGIEVIGGLAFVCAYRAAPGKVVHQDYGRLTLGNFPNGISVVTRKLVRLFKKAGIPTNATDDVTGARWSWRRFSGIPSAPRVRPGCRSPTWRRSMRCCASGARLFRHRMRPRSVLSWAKGATKGFCHVHLPTQDSRPL